MIWVKKLWYIYTMAMLNFLSSEFKTYKETSISSTASLYIPTIQLQKWCSHDQFYLSVPVSTSCPPNYYWIISSKIIIFNVQILQYEVKNEYL